MIYEGAYLPNNMNVAVDEFHSGGEIPGVREIAKFLKKYLSLSFKNTFLGAFDNNYDQIFFQVFAIEFPSYEDSTINAIALGVEKGDDYRVRKEVYISMKWQEENNWNPWDRDAAVRLEAIKII